MLESNYSNEISGLLAKLPDQVQLPPEWHDEAAQQGLLPAIENDRRRSPRKHYCHQAVLELTTTLPAIERQQRVHTVYTRTISREGISFLHAEQLFPGEVCRLWLTDGRLAVEVVRCRRINSQCYDVGGILCP